MLRRQLFGGPHSDRCAGGVLVEVPAHHHGPLVLGRLVCAERNALAARHDQILAVLIAARVIDQTEKPPHVQRPCVRLGLLLLVLGVQFLYPVQRGGLAGAGVLVEAEAEPQHVVAHVGLNARALTDAGAAARALTGDTGPLAALAELPGAHVCLALGVAGAGWANALQLWWYLRRARVFRAQPGWGRFCRQLAVASLAMAAVVLALLLAWDGWTAWHWSERVWKLAVVVGTGGLVYVAVLWLQGIRPRDLRH